MSACHSAVIWRGPSPMDGAPICAVAVISQSSRENTKTGAVVQTYILLEDIDPRNASKSGADYSICGTCPLRGIATDDPDRSIARNRICYVQLGQGPLNVFKAIQRGVYPVVRGHAAIAAIGRGRVVRLGTYGDPAMVPSYIWESLISEARGHTAYSHQANVPAANFRAPTCTCGQLTPLPMLARHGRADNAHSASCGPLPISSKPAKFYVPPRRKPAAMSPAPIAGCAAVPGRSPNQSPSWRMEPARGTLRPSRQFQPI